MLNIAAVILAIAALGGAYMALTHFQGHSPPSTLLAIGHGILAFTGLVLLGLSAVSQGAGTVLWALIFLVFAAALGFILFFGYHMQRRILPSVLVGLHGGFAVIAYVILLVALLAT